MRSVPSSITLTTLQEFAESVTGAAMLVRDLSRPTAFSAWMAMLCKRAPVWRNVKQASTKQEKNAYDVMIVV